MQHATGLTYGFCHAFASVKKRQVYRSTHKQEMLSFAALQYYLVFDIQSPLVSQCHVFTLHYSALSCDVLCFTVGHYQAILVK